MSKQGLNLHNTKMHKGLSKSKDSLPKDDPKCSVCHKSVHTTEATQCHICKKKEHFNCTESGRKYKEQLKVREETFTCLNCYIPEIEYVPEAPVIDKPSSDEVVINNDINRDVNNVNVKDISLEEIVNPIAASKEIVNTISEVGKELRNENGLLDLSKELSEAREKSDQMININEKLQKENDELCKLKQI